MNSFKRQIYKFGQLEDNDKNPPTVKDNSEEYTSGVFTFNTSHFTNEFEDLDGDSYKLTKIISLPPIGDLKYQGNLIEEEFTFNLSNVNDLTYELPNNYMITSEGYCKFDKSIEDIISEQETQGFDLTYLGNGRIEFEKITNSSLPNNTDIYAFFDATSMKIEDAEAANLALRDWYDEFKDSNPLFTGNLYILPIVQENWVNFPNLIVRGSSTRVANNSDRPSDDYMEFAILPDNFDRTSNENNPNWTAPTEVVTLAFIDESADGTQFYHKNRNGYGFSEQPSPQYLTDFRNFKNNYENHFTFFKGVFYPIPDIEYGNYNNIYNAAVLQGFAAIEGGATYTLQQIENLGVTYAKERRFHWHLDPTNSYYTGADLIVANPYSVEAETPVPQTNYNLQPLSNFGWTGSYDKDQPASSVFSSDTFNSDLNKYLQGEVTQSKEYKLIEGDCVVGDNICFDFKTSDDSDYLLFSNIATFCFTGTNDEDNVDSGNAPLVDDMNRDYDGGLYQVVVEDFTNNFRDPDGDSYLDTKILSGFKSTKGVNINELTYQDQTITYPFNFNLNNVQNLKFQLVNDYLVFNNRLHKYSTDYITTIGNLETQDYSLIYNEGNKLVFNRLNTSDPQNPFIEKESIEGKDLGEGKICLPFKTSDDSSFKLYSNTAELCLIMENINTAPIVDGWSDVLTTNEYVFSQQVFTNNFSDNENDSPKTVRINPVYNFPEEFHTITTTNSFGDEVEKEVLIPNSEKVAWGQLTYQGVTLEEDFAFNIENSSDLKFTLPDRFIKQGDEYFSFNKSVQEIISEQEDLGYTLGSNSNGLMIFEKITEQDIEYKYIEGNTVTKQEICFDFNVSDDNTMPLFSETKKVCLIVPSKETPIEFNQPPKVGDNEITLE